MDVDKNRHCPVIIFECHFQERNQEEEIDSRLLLFVASTGAYMFTFKQSLLPVPPASPSNIRQYEYISINQGLEYSLLVVP